MTSDFSIILSHLPSQQRDEAEWLLEYHRSQEWYQCGFHLLAWQHRHSVPLDIMDLGGYEPRTRAWEFFLDPPVEGWEP